MKIIFTVTNDLNYDQRMIRICNSLCKAGYDVLLVGRKRKDSKPLVRKDFEQKRIILLFQKGFCFYAEYNIRLFFYLLFKKCDALCSIDLDTIIPVYFISLLKGKKRIYDAHEYFTQQIEIISRPVVFKVWNKIEKTFVPKFNSGYTVNQSIAGIFKKKYNITYLVIRNLPVKRELRQEAESNRKFIYSGSVNEGRGFEQLIPAMKRVNTGLDIYGSGNFIEQVKSITIRSGVEDKVFLKGYIFPEDLALITSRYYAGITLFENTGLNQYLSLANRFFDYIQNGIPQICMDYPEYRRINEQFEVAILIKELKEDTVEEALNKLLNDTELRNKLAANCMVARETLNWQNEEPKLLQFYKDYLGK